jgi:hypothetical protein
LIIIVNKTFIECLRLISRDLIRPGFLGTVPVLQVLNDCVPCFPKFGSRRQRHKNTTFLTTHTNVLTFTRWEETSTGVGQPSTNHSQGRRQEEEKDVQVRNYRIAIERAKDEERKRKEESVRELSACCCCSSSSSSSCYRFLFELSYCSINWRKNNQQMHCNCVSFLKINLFVYRTEMFRLFPGHHQGACCMVQCKRTMRIFFNIQLFTLVFFSFSLPLVKIINTIFKIFCCFPLFCVVVCASRDGCLRTVLPLYHMTSTLMMDRE